jgi:hypothetical protein
LSNAFIFSWNIYGIESIIPIEEYRNHHKDQLINILKENKSKKNPLDSIIRNLIFRARYNSQRNYEIYAVDCDDILDEKFWEEQWSSNFIETAEIIRNNGYKLY